jgi:transposase
MEVVFPSCAGLDVHKKRVTACRLVSDSTGQAPEGVADLPTFGTMTHELLALADWLVEAGVTHGAMESTGEYWQPVYNLLEGVVTIFLVHASHVKNVPEQALTGRVRDYYRHLLTLQLRPIDFWMPRSTSAATRWPDA